MTESTGMEVAIVGMSGRFPGAEDVRALWNDLVAGVESIVTLTEGELVAEGVPASLIADPRYVRRAAHLGDVSLFDAEFFGINPREAESIDPQHRLFLEHAWAALEDAAYPPDAITMPVGVFAGASMSSYVHNLVDRGGMHAIGSVPFLAALFGNAPENLATRTAYKLDLKGPAMAVQTACSTGAVAIHLACQSLIHHECDMALAGGASVRIPQRAGYLPEGGMLSTDGHCRAFDAASGGTVFGNGVAVLVLRRLADAIADGDHIYAVIKGSAINNDGNAKVGYTAPSITGQAAVISEALAVADVDARTIGYVEAHGTGTPVGDPIEVTALTQAFRTFTSDTQFCGLGSIKTNLGHLDVAAGAVGVIKAALALTHGVIPASLHFSSPNPNIDFARSPFFVEAATRPWPRGDAPRRAGVSSFGVGGTNAHLVLEEAPHAPASPSSWTHQLVTLSARSEAALTAAAARLAGRLEASQDLDLADVAYSLAVGRKAFRHRRAVVCRDLAEARAELVRPGPRRSFAAVAPASLRKVAFLFSGQGSQYLGMAEGLHAAAPTFRRAFDRCCALLLPLIGRDLRDLVFNRGSGVHAFEARLADTAIAQPALFALEYALVQELAAWGVEPAAMLGHSLGEYVAACIAGVFTLEDALRIVALRGELMARCPSGAMLSVETAAHEIEPRLRNGVTIAAINGPGLCVIAGSIAAIAEAERTFDALGIGCTRLHTSHAFHSPMVEPVIGELVQAVRAVRRSPPSIPYLSNVTGTWITAEQAIDPAYYGVHLRSPVSFSAGVRTLLDDPSLALVEVGPGHALTLLARLHGGAGRTVATTRHPRETDDDAAVFLGAMGSLWTLGVPVRRTSAFVGETRRRVSLPSYPFERRRHWAEPDRRRVPEPVPASERGRETGHPLLGRAVPVPAPLWQFEAELDPSASAHAYLVHHNIRGAALVPGTAYVDLGLAAAAAVLETERPAIKRISFHEAMYLLEGERRSVRVLVAPAPHGELEFRIVSRPAKGEDRDWTVHAQGLFAAPGAAPEPSESLAVLRERCPEPVTRDAFYEAMGRWGSQFGPLFRGVHDTLRRDGEALGRVILPEPLVAGAHAYVGQPSLLDSCVNVTATTLPSWREGSLDKPFFLPSGCREVRVHGPLPAAVWVHAMLRVGDDTDATDLEGDVIVRNEDGEVLLELLGWHERRIGQLRTTRTAGDPLLLDLRWAEAPTHARQEIARDEAWIVCGDPRSALAERLIGSVRAAGIEAIALERAREGVEPLARALDALGRRCTAVVVLADEGGPELTEAGRCLEIVDHALAITRTLAGRPASPPRLVLVTRAAERVLVGDGVSPSEAALRGFARVAALEHPELHPLAIDLSRDPSIGDLEVAIQAIREGGPERDVAVRTGLRHVARLEPSASRPTGSPAFAWSTEGTVLVTGGLGGIGLRLAAHLVEHGARHVALVSRRPPDDHARETLAALAASGACVRTFAADVSQKGELANVLRELADASPPVRGIVHAAGIVDDDALVHLDRHRLERVLAPKILGAVHLHELTRDTALEFFVLFSSIAAVLGTPGQASYAAANAFLDAFAAARRAEDLPALAIDWGSWSDVGMAARAHGDGRKLEALGFGMIDPAHGLALFDRLLATASERAIVLPLHTAAARRNPMLAASPLLAGILGADDEPTAPTLHPRPALAVPFVAPRNRIERTIAEVWQDVLGIAEVGVHDSFFELGGHSLLAPQVLAALRRAFAIDLPLKLVFEADHIAGAAERIHTALVSQSATLEPERVRELLAMFEPLPR